VKLLDLFSGAGGAAKGYQRAGFHVTGVDLNPQPRYCGDEFHQGDALAFLRKYGHEFDAIHAIPPCQAYTALKTMYNAKAHIDLIPATRRALKRSGRPWVIENVTGAAGSYGY
jgi:site-specific DNA-cytosine methylase